MGGVRFDFQTMTKKASLDGVSLHYRSTTKGDIKSTISFINTEIEIEIEIEMLSGVKIQISYMLRFKFWITW